MIFSSLNNLKSDEINIIAVPSIDKIILGLNTLQNCISWVDACSKWKIWIKAIGLENFWKRETKCLFEGGNCNFIPQSVVWSSSPLLVDQSYWKELCNLQVL